MKYIEKKMPAAGAALPAVVEDVVQLEDLDEPPEPREAGGRAGQAAGRGGIMKPLVVLALPGMYLFYKYSQYRREQRELSRRRITERELQHLHHKIVSFKTNKLLGQIRQFFLCLRKFITILLSLKCTYFFMNFYVSFVSNVRFLA